MILSNQSKYNDKIPKKCYPTNENLYLLNFAVEYNFALMNILNVKIIFFEKLILQANCNETLQ